MSTCSPSGEPKFELRTTPFGVTAGVDVTQLPGISPDNALKLVYRVVRHQLDPKALDANHYDLQQRDRAVRSLRRRARSLGLQLLDTTTGELIA